MGCYNENSNDGGDVEESTSGLLSNSNNLFPVGIEKEEEEEEEGFMNFSENTGGDVLVVDKSSRDCEGFDTAVLEQLTCFEATSPQLFNCNQDNRDQLVLEKDSCSELVSLMSNCNGDIEDPVGRFISHPSQDNIAITNVGSGIDREGPLVGIDGQGDGCLNSVPLVLDQMPNNGDGCLNSVPLVLEQMPNNGDGQDDVLFYNESCQLNHFSYSQNTEEESFMEKTESHCKDGTGQSTQDGGACLAMSFSTASPTNYCTKWDEHTHAEIITPMKETVKDNKGVLPGNPSTLLTHIPQREENFCTLIEGPPKLDSQCASKGSASFQLPHVDISTSNCLGISDHHESYDSAGASTCSVADSTMPEDNGRKDIVKPNLVTLSACSDVTHLVPRRSTRGSKLIKMAETKKTNSECSKPSNSMLLSGRSLEMSLTVARGKRSCSCKRARSSVWGTLENTIQVFAVNEVFLKHDSELAQGSNRRRKGERVRNTQDAGSARRSKGKQRPAASRIRLKVKVGGERVQRNMKVVLPDVIDYTASAQSIISECALESNDQVRSETSKLFNDTEHRLGNNVDGTTQYPYPGGDLENPVTVSGATVPGFQHGERDLESSLTQDISIGIISGDCPGVSSQSATRVLGEAGDHQYLDPGTSPDSEVINLIQEAVVAEKIDEDLHDTDLSSPQVIGPIDCTAPNLKIMSTSAGEKDDNAKGPYNLAGYFTVEENFLGSRTRNKLSKSAKCKTDVRVENDLNSTETVASTTRGNASTNSSNIERCPIESIPVSGLVELASEAVIECCEKSGEDIEVRPSEVWTTEGVLATNKTDGPHLSKCSYSNVGLSKCRLRAPDSAKRERGNARQQKSVSKSKVKAKDIPVKVVFKGENHEETDGDINICLRMGNHSESEGHAEISKINTMRNDTLDDLEKTNTSNGFVSEDISKSSLSSNGPDNQILPPRSAWVCCDNCHKWRCISATLADSIEETKCQWICKDNVDKEFAKCSVPQEKTNAEINAELELSEASCEEDVCDTQSNPKGFEGKQLPVSKPASWTLIKSNLFLHRKRKTQTIDEIMVCQCKPPQDGELGCRDECLNRMLNLECGHGTCPCGNLCSNQRFQKRKYAKFNWFRSGKKGFGLQLLQNVFQGEFLIEYVGEVLNVQAYETRQKEYASRGQKHFYFMTLNGSEVIDACAKGNLGRFINHSCDPNCRTEKWIVNGEVCIGLFAVRDIKKGEEVTFDYNYERVDGAAAKRCVCGSLKCRGYIGGDPLKTEAVVQGDSDEEYPEPVMVPEDGSYEDNMDMLDPKISLNEGASVQHVESSLHVADAVIDINSEVEQLSLEKKNSTCRPSSSGQQSVFSLLTEDTKSESQSALQPLESSLETESITCETSSAIQLLEMPKEKEDHMERTSSKIRPSDLSLATSIGSPLVKPSRSKSRPHVKSSRLPNSMKKGKSNQAQVLPNKPKRLLDFASSSRLNGVEEKLNELLDADGGISKRKDSGKGYLRLLLVTAASGDNVNGEAVQSTRDLSIILDALLKTKSRTVLVDIINKNGLQMLHNIMKQNRRNFNKTPIIRKLLKVLEYLALRQILTVEHINSGPPCAGVESFKESIIELAWHNDTQVHLIARKFRDTWIPRPHRRTSCSNKDSSKMEIHNSLPSTSPCNQWQGQGVSSKETINCVAHSGPSFDDFPLNGTRSRKRKSRWDQPAEISQDPRQPEFVKDHKLEHSSQQPEISEVARDQLIEANIDRNMCNSSDLNLSLQPEGSARVDMMQQILEDVPPGFSSPFSNSSIPSSTPSESILHRDSSGAEVINGCLQARYFSHLPVSYGIPLSFVDQLGIPQEGKVGSWTVAPSVPFHPFPPLPKFPRDSSNAPPPPSYGCGGVQREGNCSATHQVDLSAPCTSRTRPPDIAAGIGASDKRMRCSSGSLSRRYFKHQKVNNWKYGPSSKKNGWGSRENNSRSGEHNTGLRNAENQISGSSCPQGVNGRAENRSSTMSQYPQHRYGH